MLAFVAVGVIFVYGFYSYNELKSALRRSNDIVKRSRLESDNLSAQLLGIAGVVVVIIIIKKVKILVTLSRQQRCRGTLHN